MKRKLFLFLILCIPLINVYTQSWEELDSLIEQNIEIAKYDTALIISELALKVVEDKYGTDDTLYANILARNSLIHYFLGNYKIAIDVLLQEKEIRDKKQDKAHYQYGRILNDLGVMNEILGNFKIAESYYISCIEVVEETLGREHPDYAILCMNIAAFHQAIGNFQKAEHYLLMALSIQKEILGDQHPDYASTLNNLGQLYVRQGNYKEAEQYNLRALNIRKKVLGEKHPDYTQSLNNLAVLYADLGNYSKAEKIFLDIILIEKEIYGAGHPNMALRLNSLAVILTEKGDYPKAIEYQTEALNVDLKNFGKKHSYYAIDLSILAGTYYKMGQYEKAEPLYIESLQILEDVFGKSHPDYCLRLYHLSNLYLKTDDFVRSEEFALEALKIRGEVLGDKHPDYTESLLQVANLYFAIDKTEEAEPYALEGIEQTSSNIYQFFSFLSDEEKELYLKTVSKRFDFFNSYAIKRKEENSAIINYVFNNSLRNKSLLLKSSRLMKQSILNSNDTSLLKKYDNLIDLRKQLSRLYAMPKDDQYENPEILENQASKIEKELVLESRLFDEYMRIKQYSWENIRDKLNPDEAAVDIIRFRSNFQNVTDSIVYAALIVTTETMNHPLLVVLENSNEIEGKYISEYNKYISKDSFVDQNSLFDIGHSCYQVFWEEIENKIADKNIIYFCPDGVFHKINMNTILFPDGEYLYEKTDLVILNSLNELLDDKYPQMKHSESAFLAGNPNFSLNNNSNIQLTENQSTENYDAYNGMSRDFKNFDLCDLPGSQLEVEEINSILKQYKWEVQCLTGNRAIEGAIKKVSNPQIVHLATHGFFTSDVKSENFPENNKKFLFGQKMEIAERFPLLRSGLMFCGSQNTIDGNYNPSERSEDGILTGYEVTNLDLRSTELVVLSACETGLGEIMNGEGVYGLQRAFKIAGVQNIMMSLWKVDDMATQLLMGKFYDFWLNGNTKREALKMARDYLRSQPKYDQPYYWGGFVLIGMEPPVKKPILSYFWILTIFIPVGILFYKRKKKRKMIQ